MVDYFHFLWVEMEIIPFIHYTEVRFASFLSGGFIQNMSQALSMCLKQWIKMDKLDYFHFRPQEMEIINHIHFS